MNYTIGWIVWFIMFFAIELPAILNKQKGDTLSEHIWMWFAIKDKPKGWRIRRFSLLSVLIWFVAHIITGGWV